MIIVVLVLAVALLLAAGLLVLTDRARRDAQEQLRRLREGRRRPRPARRPDAPVAPAPAEPVAAPPVVDEAVVAEAVEPVPVDPVPVDPVPVDPVPVDSADRERLDALWEMTVLGAAWEQRRAGDLSTAPAAAPGEGDLGSVLAGEVERLRDEGGIPGTAHVDLDPPATAGQAMVVLRGVQLLLTSLARHCDGYDVSVHRWDGRISAVVVCEGFAGPDSVADETTEVLVAVGRAGGDVDVDRDPEGRLRARLSIPD